MKGKKFLAFSLAAALLVGSAMSVSAAGVKDVFDANVYAGKYADLKAAYGTNAKALQEHFLTYGAAEGRVASDILDVAAYRKAYADLDAAFGNNWNAYVDHYLTYGIKEKRTSGVLFDLEDYAAKNPDVKAAFGEDYAAIAQHYITCGKAEGRKGGEIKQEVVAAPAVGGSSNSGSSNSGTSTPGGNQDTTVVPSTHQHRTPEQGAIAWGAGKAATCTEPGYQDYKCGAPILENVYDENGKWIGTRQKVLNGVPLTCDVIYRITIEPAHVAPESTDNYYIEHPTCTSTGLEVYTCTRCGAEVRRTLEALQHDFSVVKKSVASTGCKPEQCGYDIYACANCGLEKAPVYRAPLPHSVEGYPNVERKSTCLVKGSAYGYCEACGAKISKELPIADHTPSNPVTVYADSYLNGDAAPNHDVFTITYCTVDGCNEITSVETTVTRNVPCTKGADGACTGCGLPLDRNVTDQVKEYKVGQKYLGQVQ